MERISIKFNDLSPLISVLIEKIQLLDSSILTKQQKLTITKEMVEVIDHLRQFFEKATEPKNDKQNKSFIEKIEMAFSLFDWTSNIILSPYDFNKFSENGKVLISSILKLLGTKGCGILIIETYVKLCLKVISDLADSVENQNLSVEKSNFKLLLDGFSATANIFKKYWHISLSEAQKNTIMLCLHQICKILPYLLKMIQFQYTGMKKYLLNILAQCLTKIQSEIHSDGASKSNNSGQDFINRMDFCLHKLNELSNYNKDFTCFIEKANDTVNVLKPIIDELLCSVMSIAQVTIFNDDYAAILGCCQKILKELSELKNEIEEEKSSAIKLNASSLGESLCSLEQKVNVAVLKLVLEVFSSVNSPLKNILNQCRRDIGKDNKTSEDLNVLISDFDLEMDRIMQIGFFTISCTSSLNRILQIQSCLASLESLETELIPSLTALYLDCNPQNRANFQCLFDFWLNEITELKNLVDSVLDPAGFCGVVNTQIKSLSLAFKENSISSNICINKLKYNLKQGIRYSRKLIRTLKTSMEDEKEVIVKNIEDHLAKFQLALQECEAVLELMDEGQDTNKIINQAIKRYDFLMFTLDKLSLHLFDLMGKEDDCNGKESFSDVLTLQNIHIPRKNYYKLWDMSDNSVAANCILSSVPEILTPYVNKGILWSKKRNILYKTPLKVDEDEDKLNRTVLQTRHWDKTPISTKRSRCCKPLTLNLELENTIDLEITTILENISRLSNSFSRTLQAGDQVQYQVHSEVENVKPVNRKDVSCGLEKSTEGAKKPSYTSSGCCANLDSEGKAKNEKQLEDAEDEKKFLGFKLRNQFLQTLDNLSHNDSLFVANDDTVPSCVNSSEIINDLKIVEEKINFLKTRMPSEML